jgi:3-hydroxyisobutyrate dehydrogenase-like beta-hydroxyacid dehydrogenase
VSVLKSPAVGFIGFGEAAFHIARGLGESDLGGMRAYDIHRDTPGRGEKIRERAALTGVELVNAPADLSSGSQILLSLVVADAAVDAARAMAPGLSPDHLYADLNSVSPSTKEAVAAIVAGRGASFVEGAIMAPVPRHGHRVPILLGGMPADALLALMAPLGMHLEKVSDRVGSAAAVKMCRSVVVKGLEAVLLECVLTAIRYEADRRVFDSLGESFPGIDWGALASYMTSRVALHAERRAQEMREVARTLEDVGVEPIMTLAAARRQQWCADLHLEQASTEGPPGNYAEIARIIQETLSRSEKLTTEESSG